MKPKFTNAFNLPMSMAVWLVDTTYDYINKPKYISATTLLKTTREIILTNRLNNMSEEELQEIGAMKFLPDLSDNVSRAMGNSIHDGFENSWTQRYADNLRRLGVNKDFIDIVRVNPDRETMNPNNFNIFIEQRAFIEVNGWTVGGKYDVVMDGQLEDIKSTSTFAYVNGSRDEDFIKQGSIYRLAAPEIITKDTLKINYVFTDWQGFRVKTDPNYPPARTIQKTYPLMSKEDTLKFIEDKLAELEKYADAPQNDIPRCTDEELWMSPTTYKYYKDPDKRARATRNFDDYREAVTYMNIKGKGEGIIITEKGEAKKCAYCSAAPICEQFKELNPELF